MRNMSLLSVHRGAVVTPKPSGHEGCVGVTSGEPSEKTGRVGESRSPRPPDPRGLGSQIAEVEHCSKPSEHGTDQSSTWTSPDPLRPPLRWEPTSPSGGDTDTIRPSQTVCVGSCFRVLRPVAVPPNFSLSYWSPFLLPGKVQVGTIVSTAVKHVRNTTLYTDGGARSRRSPGPDGREGPNRSRTTLEDSSKEVLPASTS